MRLCLCFLVRAEFWPQIAALREGDTLREKDHILYAGERWRFLIMLSEFGEKAKAYRFRHGWLLYDMAKVMRVSTAQLSAYEIGKKEPSRDVREALEALIACESKRGLTDEEMEDLKKRGQEFKLEMKRIIESGLFRG